MATPNRAYPEVPLGAAPDVPFYVNRALRAIDADLKNAGVRVDNSVGRRAFAWDAANNREQMIYGDTGWRDITGTTPAGIETLSVLYIRRIGNLVTFVSQGLSSSTAGNVNIYITPAGFKPDAPSIRAGLLTSRDGAVVRQVSPYNGAIRVLELPANVIVEGGITYISSDPWPTTLPGQAVGSIPA